MRHTLIAFSAYTILAVRLAFGAEPLRLAVFETDASPPIGSPMAYNPAKEVTNPLSCRGIVLLPENAKPIVLCAVDWIGISNESQDSFRRALARAAGTSIDRVVVHTLHQHDAPWCDFTADKILAPYGINEAAFDVSFERFVIERAAAAVSYAIAEARPVTDVGLGQAEVHQVASNRRILGPDGKVQFMRYTACADRKIRDKPAGTVDSMLKMISLWNGDQRLAVLTYFATHPQSYYRTGQANPDFPGLARDQRQRQTHVFHVHFDGAGGNIGAGKWNDGSHENRQVLTDRMARGMADAWDATTKFPITAEDVGWESVAVALPVAPHLDEKKLLTALQNVKAPVTDRVKAASDLAWLRRCKAGDTIDVSCLRLGQARVLHMPGELFVEYQLAAQAMRPDLFVAMAAYGDYAPGYIGTRVAYEQGGYETSPESSLVAPSVEAVLTNAMRRLLHAQSAVPRDDPASASFCESFDGDNRLNRGRNDGPEFDIGRVGTHSGSW